MGCDLYKLFTEEGVEELDMVEFLGATEEPDVVGPVWTKSMTHASKEE